jgi:NADH dehydrogenase [ubiquinone] 1 alpha subcomplex assembly factor 3
MASILRTCRLVSVSSLRAAASRQHSSHSASFAASARVPQRSSQLPTATNRFPRIYRAPFHTTTPVHASRAQAPGGNPAPTSLGLLDVLGNIPAPATSVDVCMSSGFQLNNGTRVTDGSGVLLVGGEAFCWRPWDFPSSSSAAAKPDWRLQNKKGQYDIAPQSLSLLAHLWPRPDLLILGLGSVNRPLSPELRKAISALGIRVEVLDTRNAAAQYNLLATERGVNDVAAALIPIGWVEGKGAGDGDDGVLTHE